MKIALSIFLILCRFFVGIKILYWIIEKFNYPQIHSISEIELFLVIVVFDTWISSSQSGIDIKINKKDD
jgi:hypothetical protein